VFVHYKLFDTPSEALPMGSAFLLFLGKCISGLEFRSIFIQNDFVIYC